MDGVTILQTIPMSSATWGFSIAGFIFALCALEMVILACIYPEWGAPFLLGAIAFVFVSLSFFLNAKTVEHTPRYQVLIDENVSMVEFTERYNIIE